MKATRRYPDCCRIALTSGLGSGKTTDADLFRRKIGVHIPGGFRRSCEPRRLSIFHVQRNLEDVQAALKPVSLAELKFRTAGAGKSRDVDLLPFFAIHDRRQTVFFDIFCAAEWADRETEILADRKREAELSSRTVDLLRIGEQQPEKDHNLKGGKSRSGESNGRKQRDAADGGWRMVFFRDGRRSK